MWLCLNILDVCVTILLKKIWFYIKKVTCSFSIILIYFILNKRGSVRFRNRCIYFTFQSHTKFQVFLRLRLYIYGKCPVRFKTRVNLKEKVSCARLHMQIAKSCDTTDIKVFFNNLTNKRQVRICPKKKSVNSMTVNVMNK